MVLKGTALVTGSARGIGRALALALAKKGFHIVVHYKSSQQDAEATAELCRKEKVQATTLKADVTDVEQARELVQQAHIAFKDSSLAVLVNNVGNYVHKPLLETSDAEWAEMMGSNLTSTFATCQTAAPIMQEAGFGRMINLGYAGAQHLVARPGIVPYLIAKTGVLHLSKALAVVLADTGVTVNVISPGVIETSVSKPVREIPAGRLGTVQELVAAAMYFVSASDYITGQELEVAGGWNL